MLEQAKTDAQVSKNGASLSGKRRRFKIVIHSSPFLRCVQTSVGISSGLAQTLADSIYEPADVIVSRTPPNTSPPQFKSALLRLDACLGEWLSPEYFEMITPPPGSALMIGGAKADLLRREDYSIYTDFTPPPPPIPSTSLWHSPTSSPPPTSAPAQSSETNGSLNLSALTTALPSLSKERKEGYVAPQPMYAVSSGGKIPDGFVAHARDACVMVDYQWDSMREPLEFGDGGKLGEEWSAMHQRFRAGLRKLVNWYATAENPDELLSAPLKKDNGEDVRGEKGEVEEEDEEVETVIIIVSHGAGCNALIGAITHQPVLMDVAIASITMALRKPDLDYQKALSKTRPRDSKSQRLVAVDQLYDIRLSATTEHLRSNSSTPISARSSTANIWNGGRRGRTSTLGSSTGPILSAFSYREPFSSSGSRSSSAGAAMGPSFRRESGSRQSPRRSGLGMSEIGISSNGFQPSHTPPSGLWSPAPSSLRLMDDGSNDEAVDDFDSLLPDFDNRRFQPVAERMAARGQKITPVLTPVSIPELNVTPTSLGSYEVPTSPIPIQGPVLAAPIRLNTSLGGDTAIEEVKIPQLGGGAGGLWGLPLPPSEAERFRDLSHSKRRWTVNERAL